MDVAVHPLQPAAGTLNIEPPATMDGYWLTPFGQPGVGSDNTTYVIGHSWLDRDAPFNHLSSAAAVGGQFTVTTATGVLSYRVESVSTHSKPALKDSAIWDVVPNRLVLISCYSADPWGSNVTVVASPILAP
jgi:sortase (surface protein transpeptidase)